MKAPRKSLLLAVVFWVDLWVERLEKWAASAALRMGGFVPNPFAGNLTRPGRVWATVRRQVRGWNRFCRATRDPVAFASSMDEARVALKALGRPYKAFFLDAWADMSDLVGWSKYGRTGGTWIEGPMAECIRSGHVVLIDAVGHRLPPDQLAIEARRLAADAAPSFRAVLVTSGWDSVSASRLYLDPRAIVRAPVGAS